MSGLQPRSCENHVGSMYKWQAPVRWMHHRLFNHAYSLKQLFSVAWYKKIVTFGELEGVVYKAVMGNFRTP